MLVLLLTALVLLVCLVLLSSLCLHCYKRPMVSIRQTHTSEETYIPSTQFLSNRPMQYSIDPNYVHPPSNLLLSPHFSLEGTPRPSCPSFTPTETESNNSYENADSCGCLDSEEEGVPDPGYIEVLPETAPPVANVSRPSSPSSESDDNYENTEHNYVNVGEPEISINQSQASTLSCDQLDTNQSQDSSEHSDSDDEGDYVNQPSRSEERPSA